MKSGLLLLVKPEGLTSHDVVARVRKILGTKEVGHTGTLDPFATGLMILVVGEATKISDYLRDSSKRYEVEAQLGVTTDTLDKTGVVLSQKTVRLSETEILNAAYKLVGTFEWPVPYFSAVKKNGEKLYERARRGEKTQVPLKSMTFSDLEYLGMNVDRVRFRISCTSGSYIRTWVTQLGEALLTGATAASLSRLSTAGYELERAVDLSELEVIGWEGLLNGHKAFVELEQALPHVRGITISGRDEEMLLNGTVSYDLVRRLNPWAREVFADGLAMPLRVISGASGRLLSILEIRPQEGVKVRRIFRM